MKNVIILPTLAEYREYIDSMIVVNDEFRNADFYRGLVSFIIDHRTPIFFEASHEYERSHFTQYFNFSLLWDEYDNPYISDLYFIHDFVHMVFRNPLEPRAMSFDEFSALSISNEYVAANETEICTYYRLPGLRAKTFKEPILYDYLSVRHQEIPDVKTLYELRKAIVETKFVETFFMKDAAEQRILAFLKKFNANNASWCRLWYTQFPEIHRTALATPPTLSYEDFGPRLMSYVPLHSEERYRHNILYNTRILLEMLEARLPETFEECRDALRQAEGKVVMEEGAREFYDTFINSKKGAAW